MATPESAGQGTFIEQLLQSVLSNSGLFLWPTTTPKGVSLVKLIEPPCTGRYARWCERSEIPRFEEFPPTRLRVALSHAQTRQMTAEMSLLTIG